MWSPDLLRRLWSAVYDGRGCRTILRRDAHGSLESNQSPATYAVVGAACFAASATQTVSTAVIFFELTGQLSHMVPVMVACIAAYFVSGIFTPSIYDILASWAGMNSVCYDFNEHVLSQKVAKDYMGSVPVVFTRDTTYEEAIQALVSGCVWKLCYFPAYSLSIYR